MYFSASFLERVDCIRFNMTSLYVDIDDERKATSQEIMEIRWRQKR